VNELALFAGAGGGILGGVLSGWRTVAAVEIEEYPRAVLLRRQADGLLPRFPVWDDVRTFDGKPWRGRVDVISGGFPCQDISAAGKGAGINGARSGLWSEFARIIGEVRPRYVLVENSPMLVGRGLTRVLGDLASLGFDARWGVIGAHHAGAPHKRDRIWIVAQAQGKQAQPTAKGRFFAESCNGDSFFEATAHADSKRLPASFADNSEAFQKRMEHPRGVNLVEHLQRMNNGESTGMKLQAGFAEWMMGYPPGWTDIGPTD